MAFTREKYPEFFKEIDKAFLVPEKGLLVSEKDRRILVVGTRAEVRELREKLGNEAEGKELVYVSHITRLWPVFFNISDFTDLSEMSLPEKIITTGFIRTSVYFNETVDVKGNLENLAQYYNLPIEFVPPTNI